MGRAMKQLRGAPARQRGLAMIAIVTLFALMSSYLIVNGMARTQNEVLLEQERQTLKSLQEAKSALIAYAASQAWSGSSANDQPGALPCPASDEGGVSGTCSATASTRVGRFPWKTVKTTDLRDSSGHVLWYALSANFRNASGTTVINSDTQGTLSVTGDSPFSNVVAVIIAPGNPLNGQERSVNSISNYLESTNATNTDTFVTGQVSTTFNDRLIVITQADLMSVVEPAVAGRIERDIKPYLQAYNTEWGAYPFPSTFANPSPGTSGSGTNRAQSTYVGSTSETSGLLPVSASASYSWTTSVGTTVTLTGGIASSTISSVSCYTITSATPVSTIPFPALQCRFTLNALNSTTTCGSLVNRYCMNNPQFLVTGGIGANAGVSFADLPSVSTVKVTSTGGATRTMSSTAISGTLTSGGVGTVNYSGTHVYSRYASSTFTRTMMVTIPDVVASTLTSSSDVTAGWFIKNEWFRQTYYAVSPGFLPGGGASCVAGSTCLTVNNLPSSYTTANDKRALLIFAGRALTGSRPSTSLSDYLENQNSTPADRIFTHRFGSTSTINDYAVVVAP
jgi:hypothetical protein